MYSGCRASRSCGAGQASRVKQVSDGKQAGKMQARVGRQGHAPPQTRRRNRTCGAAWSRLFAARDPLDLGGDETFHDAWQIVVEPGLEHRTQHLAGKTDDDIAMLDKPAGEKGVEGGARTEPSVAVATLERGAPARDAGSAASPLGPGRGASPRGPPWLARSAWSSAIIRLIEARISSIEGSCGLG